MLKAERMLPLYPPEAESESTVEQITKLIAQAFCRSRYPLTPEGERLRKEVESALRTEDTIYLDELRPYLPTVENPHLELFADLLLTTEERDEVFSSELSVIQIGRGCRHRCLHCAAASEKLDETPRPPRFMPFAAALKIGEVKHDVEQRMKQLWPDWLGILENYLLEQTELIDKLRGDLRKILSKMPVKNYSTEQSEEDKPLNHLRFRWEDTLEALDEVNVANIFYPHDSLNALLTIHPQIKNHPWFKANYVRVKEIADDFQELLNGAIALYRDHPLHPILKRRPSREYTGNDDRLTGLRIIYPPEVAVRLRSRELMLHYDENDPFDYRDLTFLHEDGTPADYGDVVEAHATPLRPFFFSTAGWPLDDEVAQRAAKKIVHLHARYPECVEGRISIHSGSQLFYRSSLREDSSEYRAASQKYRVTVEKVIRALAPLGDKLIISFFMDQREQTDHVFLHEVALPLQMLCRALGLRIAGETDELKNNFGLLTISRFAGRLANKLEAEPSDDDIMGDTPGYYLRPTGEVEYMHRESDCAILKGVRPKATGLRVF